MSDGSRLCIVERSEARTCGIYNNTMFTLISRSGFTGSCRLLGRRIWNDWINFISQSCMGRFTSLIHDTSACKVNKDTTHKSVIHSFGRCLNLNSGDNCFLSSFFRSSLSSNNNINFPLLLSLVNLSQMGYYLSFHHSPQVVSSFVLNEGS